MKKTAPSKGWPALPFSQCQQPTPDAAKAAAKAAMMLA
jgi:hypothetical protein